MRYIVLLLISSACWGNLLSLASSFTDDSEQPTFCCGPCSKCRPGFYIGGLAGYAWIDSPREDCGGVRILYSQRGHFSWGAFAGYNKRLLQTVFVGIQGGYNDNGYSRLELSNGWCGTVRSRDWELLGTVSAVSCKCFTGSFKAGVASVTETCCCKRREYHPTLTIGGGVCLLKFFTLFVQYRGVYAYHNEYPLFRHVSSVNGFSGGLAGAF